MTLAYYNENDRYAAQWLRNLMAEGYITQGVVDERSITEVWVPGIVADTTRCHFFAGIAGWDYALQLAGWPANRPVWTGSCPCQPFSQAGKRRGVEDERHLWPVWFQLIAKCRPPTIFGEQVASKAGRLWLDGVRADLETLGYAVGAADLCAASAGAPHIRQRLWWVANAKCDGRRTDESGREAEGRTASGRTGEDGRVGDAMQPTGERGTGSLSGTEASGGGKGVPDGDCPLRPTDASKSILIPCRDGVWRRTQPGIFPLAHGVPKRVGKLRAYGNAIVPALAAEFVKAYLETEKHAEERWEGKQ